MVAELRAYSQANGDILFGTDIGYIDHYDTALEFTLMSRAGMNYQQILASLTTNPARKFRYSDRVGVIAKGMEADLVAPNHRSCTGHYGIFQGALHNPQWKPHLSGKVGS
jgi:imidazolonepropionase-like amidohydrolase